MPSRYTSQSLLNLSASTYQSIAGHWADFSGTIRRTLLVWHRRAARRNALRDHLRCSDASRIEKDVGMAPGTLEREAQKPFWRV